MTKRKKKEWNEEKKRERNLSVLKILMKGLGYCSQLTAR